MKKVMFAFALAILVFMTVSPAYGQQIQNLYAAGVSYNNGATPAIAGTGLYAHAINNSGTYAFTAMDAVPASRKPFTVNTNMGFGVAQKVATMGIVSVYMPTAAGISFNGTNTGWQWNGGAIAVIPVKNQYYIMPTVRFMKSSIGGAGYQPILGILFGWGK